MDSFESLVAMLLKREGYWTTTSFKVKLDREDKAKIGRPSCPRWEIDVLAYKGGSNEILAVECKSFLDSVGVVFRNGKFEPEQTYKLFTDARIWPVVEARLKSQLCERQACVGSPSVTLCLAAGHIARKSDRIGLKKHFDERGWRLLDEEWLRDKLRAASKSGYENAVAHVVAKLLKSCLVK
jgi:hypothetical protein